MALSNIELGIESSAPAGPARKKNPWLVLTHWLAIHKRDLYLVSRLAFPGLKVRK